MREYTEQEKEKEKKSDKIGKRFENEFQPESRFEEKDDLGNEFIPSDENPNSADLMDNTFEPIDDAELNPKPRFNIHPDEYQRIRDEKQTEESDRKYIKEKYGDKGKPIEVIKLKSKENSKLVKKIESSDTDFKDKKHPTKKFKLNQNQKIGSISELSLIRDLERNGKNVSIPYGDFQRYDILIEEKGKIDRVQVKTMKNNESFPVYSSYRKGEIKSYKGEIEYFGIYNRKENKSFLVPMSEIEGRNNISSVKLDDSTKERFEVKNRNLDGIKGEKFTDTIIDEMIHLTQDDKVVLAQFGRKDENTVIYDSIVKKNNEDLTHHVNEIEMKNRGEIKEVNIEAPSKIEIARVNIAADLMSNGYIISTPVSNNPNYDFIIQQKYSKKTLSNPNKLFKVKVFENYTRSKNHDKHNEDFDYIGIYNDKSDKSYLIPSQFSKKEENNSQVYEIKRKENLLKEMTPIDRGDATELRLAAEFIKHGYNVLHPIVGRPPFDLIVKKKKEVYTIEVKTAGTFKEKDSTYIRFDLTHRKPNIYRNLPRETYKGKVDFIASSNQDNLKSYIVPVNMLPNYDAKLKLDRRIDMRRMHHGTLRAEDYEFGKLDDIVKKFKNIKKQEELNKKLSQEIESMSPKKRKILEKTQILDVLRGNKGVREVLPMNSVLTKIVTQFKELHPKSNVEYQGVLSVNLRDFLISQPDLKPIINKCLKENGLHGTGEEKHQIVYDYIVAFYIENNRGPSSLELYQTFLNFKSHELRGKINRVREMDPHYYS